MKKKHRGLRKLIPILLSLGILMSHASIAFANEIDTYQQIDAYLESSLEKLHLPAMSIVIVDKEKVLFSNTYGACKSLDEPFIIGSVSKSFTALCIMQLVEEGKLTLESKLSAFLPEIADSDLVTIKQLLNQTTGYDTYQTLDTVKVVNEQGKHVYANVNYAILGKVIEKVSGQSYDDYISEHVFNPLAMTHSAANYKQSEANGLIAGYSNYFGFPSVSKVNYPKGNSWAQVPAGYISASASDMGKYLQMYLNNGGELLDKSSIEAMYYDNVYVEGSEPYYYGMGWTVAERDGKTILGHTGLVENYMSNMFILPDANIGIMMLVNTNDYFVTDPMMDTVSASIVLMLMGEQPVAIDSNAYLMKHIIIDGIFILMLVIAMLPLLRHKKFIVRLKKGKKLGAFLSFVLINVLYPTILFAGPYYLLKTPLWAVKDFATDVWIVTVVSGVLAYLGAILRIVALLRCKNEKA